MECVVLSLVSAHQHHPMKTLEASEALYYKHYHRFLELSDV